MRNPLRTIIVGVGIVIVLSIVGLPGAASVVAFGIVTVGLISVLLLSLAPHRTKASRSGYAHAQRINFLARYSDALGPAEFGTALIAGFAVWEIVNAFKVGLELSVLLASFGIAVVTFALRGAIRRWLIMAISMGGALGAVVTIYRVPAADESRLVLLLATAIGVIVVGCVRAGLPFLPAVLLRRRGLRGVELLSLSLFGLLELAGFVASPAGIDIWSTIDWPAAILVLGCFAAVAALAAYGPEITVSLVGVGLLLANLYLIGMEMRLTTIGDPVDVIGGILVVVTVAGGATVGLTISPVD